MGTLTFVVCHDCKEILELEKWYPPRYFLELAAYLEELFVGLETGDLNSAAYNFEFLFEFVVFVCRHNGHRVEFITEYELDKASDYRRVKKSEFGRYLPFEWMVDRALKIKKVAEILNELKYEGIIDDWWNLASNDYPTYQTGNRDAHFYCSKENRRLRIELTNSELRLSKDKLKSVIIQKIQS